MPPLSPLVARLWVSLNVSKYPLKCLNKLFWLYQGSEYAWSSYMFNRLLKMPRVLNKARFWIWFYGCICKGYAEFRICLIMAPYASMTPEYASLCLNTLQYVWTWPLDMPRYNCDNIIIIVTNVITLEFSSARFAHSGDLLSFFKRVRTHKNNESY